MKRIVKSQYLTMVACMMAGVLGGVLASAGAKMIALNAARGQVAQYADNLAQRAEAITRETDTTLEQANQIVGVPCSQPDLANLRRIAFSARYVKDMGRVIDGRLMCTTSIGAIDPPLLVGRPDFIGDRGRRIWVKVPLALAPGIIGTIIESGNANAVLSPGAFLDLEFRPFRYSIAIVNLRDRTVMRSWGNRIVNDSVLIEGGNRVVDSANDLVRIHCSEAYPICAVAALTRVEAVARQSGFAVAFAVIGSAAGLLLALSISLLSRKPRTLIMRLAEALRTNEITVVYQPIVDLTSGRMVSAEALVRWTDKSGENIPPDVFVPVAEDKGLAGEITVYVLREIGRSARSLLLAHPELVLTINIVAADLDDVKFYEVLDEIVQSGLPASQIGVELTERSTVVRQIAIPAIARLRRQGHPVYLDDFGTGYSSLAYLQDLGVDAVKIDKAFTDTVGTDSVKVSITPLILEMARSLHLGVVVEGIETNEQRNYFAKALPHCRGQGWLFSRPLTITQLVSFYGASMVG
ncbi:sensor c-di-GMP phosphodiesterase, contains CSS-motif sensor and EAL domain [Phyllobacterium sp. YR620]|uniref:EAL domain-containing protein n=1 Tax=Phyllobacterium sp. YR620 TaxID=1881066 RepID=UPI0008811FA9|nr:EAL domain-containing protein [Phyllobacterium sp. YR620]SDP89221.1 sensor c-di-GMP phosphodiesterase, contains CSS-motif sensor and EAL domain [Phyllobacterium sp. YR620]